MRKTRVLAVAGVIVVLPGLAFGIGCALLGIRRARLQRTYQKQVTALRQAIPESASAPSEVVAAIKTHSCTADEPLRSELAWLLSRLKVLAGMKANLPRALLELAVRTESVALRRLAIDLRRQLNEDQSVSTAA